MNSFNNKTTLNWIWPVAFILVFIFQLYFHLPHINGINELSLWDGDSVYLVERFLINAKYPGIKTVNSLWVEYGY